MINPEIHEGTLVRKTLQGVTQVNASVRHRLQLKNKSLMDYDGVNVYQEELSQALYAMHT